MDTVGMRFLLQRREAHPPGRSFDQLMLPSLIGGTRGKLPSLEFFKIECETGFSGGQAERDAAERVF
jgi:hypothetical protein